MVIWQLVVGHILFIGGCYLVALGANLLPQSKPTPRDILTKPLFWGLVAILGGFCFVFAPLVVGA